MANKIAFQWEPPPPEWIKFNVAGVALEDEAGYGGVLSDDKGVACALLSETVEIIVIKTVVVLYIGLRRQVKFPLIIKISLCVALEWLMNRNCKLWSLRNLFSDIDCGINQLD
ncbi:hypothetical protein J1N35_020074 [Gossypium stocksii]|uniref:RNase H type-1 domain-containing protein n=1 Tax=Gossypium stocksii TaxID=47602 RepID=A0A9D3VBP6_9ROSI|nr:hypothetical protein J1N35_020074 [Gossypium stocksii]